MATLGRKLLPLSDPRTPAEQFAWLVRAIRCCHQDPLARNTLSFSKVLGTMSQEELKPATINRLENATLEFTIERCIAFEKALGLESCALVDPYIWLCRQSGCAPRTGWSRAHEAGSEEIELIVRITAEEPLSALDWIRITLLHRNRPDLFASSRLREVFFHGILRDYGRCYERDQRLMREALINVGEHVLPYMLTYSKSASMQYFNTVEILGYLPMPLSKSQMTAILHNLENSFLAPAVLEAVARNARLAKYTIGALGVTGLLLRDFAFDALIDTGELYLVREAALSLARLGQMSFDARQQRALDDHKENLGQLAVRPAAADRADYLSEVLGHCERHLTEDRLSGETPSRMPGLSAIVSQGVFGADRLNRLGAGLLLGSWQHAPALTSAVGKVMCQVPHEDFGVQRSMTRFITKMGSGNLNTQLRALAAQDGSDENTRLTVAWALGSGTDDEQDAASLDSLWRLARSRSAKLAVVTAAYRRGFRPLLAKVLADSDPMISREARRSILLLGGRPGGREVRGP